MFFEDLCRGFSMLKEVDAIALGGSRAGDNYDKNSDYDLYVYVNKVPDEHIRKSILEKYCSYMEIGNDFWELEDDCTLKDCTDIDILYRCIDYFEKDLDNVVFKCISHNGYTTCMWHNLLNCKILFDRNGKLTQMKHKFTVPYPAGLKKNIIERNLKLLRGFLPSYEGQIKKAAGRKDLVAVNHRIAAFMESYFDIIFALNEMTHPGEKREIFYAMKAGNKLPEDFETNINRLFENMFTDSDSALHILHNMICNLDKLIESENWLLFF